jgi:uncharacterized protein YbjQ (UPF0145 family)
VDVSAALHSARQQGADGVVGVRLAVEMDAWGELRVGFLAIGTAVRGYAGRRQPRPFTSALSGRDFYALRRGGYHPVDLVMGACVWHVARRTMGQWLSGLGRNVELAGYTAGLYAARELAMERMTREAAAVGARGIVGVRVEERPRAWGSHTVEFLAIGTAVTPIATLSDGMRPAPVLGLESG